MFDNLNKNSRHRHLEIGLAVGRPGPTVGKAEGVALGRVDGNALGIDVGLHTQQNNIK